MTRKTFLTLLLAALAAPLAACGKKGPLEPPATGETDETRGRKRPEPAGY